MTTRIATCACGQLTVTCMGEPRRVSACHCLACQKRTGSTHGVVAFFAQDQVTWAGRTTAFRRRADSGQFVTFRFCPDCGATVYWEAARLPGLIGVAVGSFADPSFPAPDQAVWTEHKHPWVTIATAPQEQP